MTTMKRTCWMLTLALLAGAAGCTEGGGGEDTGLDQDVIEFELPDGEVEGNACRTDYDCSDGVFCNGVEKCTGGACRPGETPDCADAYACTADGCDEDFNTCRHDYVDELCNDGNVCNGVERCLPTFPFNDPATGCVTGTPVLCDDFVDCTEDFCDGESGACLVRIRDADRDGHADRACSLEYVEGLPIEGTDCYDPGDPGATPEPGTVCKGTDCNDGDAGTYPEAGEVCDDGVDNNCDRMADLHDTTCFPGNDTCASPEELPADGGSTLGSTRGTADDYTTGCGGASKTDVVFVLRLTEDHDVGLNAFGDFPATIALRSSCSDPAAELYCAEDNLWARGLEAGTYYVIVEGASEGNFDLSVELAPYTEVYNVPSTNDTCTSPYVLPPEGGLFIGSTTGMANNLTASCGSSSASPDAVFELTLAERKVVTVSTTTTYDGTLHMHSSPCVGGAEVACNDDSPDTRHSRIAPTVNAGTYYIIVDGYSSSASGNYEMNVVITDPP